MRTSIMQSARALRRQPWPASPAVPQRLDASQALEEERSPWYDPKHFYPARLGEVLQNQYQLVCKLGSGTSSTAWLARDLTQWRWKDDRYVTVKIHASNQGSVRAYSDEELKVLRRITSCDPQHQGWHSVRKLCDNFLLQGTSGDHVCLVFETTREGIDFNRRRWRDGLIPPEVVKIYVLQALRALDYLHNKCRIIHTDLKPDNIMMKVENTSILNHLAKEEFDHPLPQKVCEDGRVIYRSRKDLGSPQTQTRILADIEIVDFDTAVDGDKAHNDHAQADIYRAPEVTLRAGYDYSVDIWSLGVLIWDLVEGKPLFEAVDPHIVGEYDERAHLAYIAGLLGPAPQSLLERGERTAQYYDSGGTLKGSEIVLPENLSLETSLTKFDAGGKEKEAFLRFIRRMLKWDPRDRSTARELLEDPWLPR